MTLATAPELPPYSTGEMCGSTAAQQQLENEQASAYQVATQEAQQVFGMNTALYNNLISAFQPILQAGPNQQGFNAQELSALNTEATTGVAANYQNAEKAARTQYASEGGGNEYIPSGQEEETEADVAAQAARQESTEQNQITEANYETGRSNWETAIQALESAPSVLSTGATYENAGTNAGSAAATTANQIAEENNSVLSSITGMVGGLGSAVLGDFNFGGGGGGSSSQESIPW